MASGAEQLRIPCRSARRARVERVGERRRACDPPAHPGAAEVRAAAEPDQPAGYAAALRRDRQPPGRNEVERPGVAPDFADDAGQRGASYAFLHRPQRVPRIARLDMDEVARRKAGRMNPPTFENRHSVLDPQQGLGRIDLGQQEPCPSRVARVPGEEFGQGRFPPLHLQGRGTMRSMVEGPSCGIQNPSVAAAPRHLPRKSGGGDFTPSGDSPAGDQRQASCHTTHNVFVLLLFLSGDSQRRVNPATRAAAFPQPPRGTKRSPLPPGGSPCVRRRTPCGCRPSRLPCRARRRGRAQPAAR